jgi:hypothetical protein
MEALSGVTYVKYTILSRPLFAGTLRSEGASVKYTAFFQVGKLSSSQVVLSVVWLATTIATRSAFPSLAPRNDMVVPKDSHGACEKSPKLARSIYIRSAVAINTAIADKLLLTR